MSSTHPSRPSFDVDEPVKNHRRLFKEEQYESLLEDTSDFTLLNKKYKTLFGTHFRWPSVLFCAAIITFAVSGILFIYTSLRIGQLQKAGVGLSEGSFIVTKPLANTIPASNVQSPTGAEFGDCGHSIDEAKAAGCMFDPMSWVWTAPACYHKDLIEDWWARSDWHFYNNWTMQAEDEVSRELVESGEHMLLYTDMKYHKDHCAYMWQKTQKILVNHMPIDSNLHALHHMKHCEMVLLNDIFHEDTQCADSQVCLTQLTPIWSTCGWW